MKQILLILSLVLSLTLSAQDSTKKYVEYKPCMTCNSHGKNYQPQTPSTGQDYQPQPYNYNARIEMENAMSLQPSRSKSHILRNALGLIACLAAASITYSLLHQTNSCNYAITR